MTGDLADSLVRWKLDTLVILIVLLIAFFVNKFRCLANNLKQRHKESTGQKVQKR
jgi:hypothetical protein